MIKIDVDGIEHLILEGAKETLKNPICKTVLVEIDDSFKKQADESKRILTDCHFTLKEKHRVNENTYNQIWCKD